MHRGRNQRQQSELLGVQLSTLISVCSLSSPHPCSLLLGVASCASGRHLPCLEPEPQARPQLRLWRIGGTARHVSGVRPFSIDCFLPTLLFLLGSISGTGGLSLAPQGERCSTAPLCPAPEIVKSARILLTLSLEPRRDRSYVESQRSVLEGS